MGSREDYAEAMALVEDPDLDEATKVQLRAGIKDFESANPQLAAKVHVPETAWLGAPSGIDALDQSLNKPLSGEEYVKKKSLLEGHVQEKAALHKERARRESTVEPVTTMPEQTARSIQRGLAEFEEESPEEIPEQGKRDTGGQVLFGDNGEPYVSEGATAALGSVDQDIDRKREQLGLIGFDEELPSASKRTDLYAPPEHIPQGLGVADLLTAGYYYEPSVEVAKAALKARGWSSDEVDHLHEQDQAYKNFADAMWLETYERAEAEGKPAIRVAYMNDDGWLGGAAKVSAKVLSKAVPVAYGADASLTGGALTEGMGGAIDLATGGDVRRQGRQAMEDSPVLTGAGAVVGALNPRSLASRLYSGATGAATRAGAGALPASAFGAAAAGGVGSATESAVRNLGEQAFAADPNLISGPEALERAGYAGALSAPFGPLGEVIGSGAGKLVRHTREKMIIGPKLTQGEQAGVTTRFMPLPGFSAVKRTPEIRGAQRAAAEAGQGKTAKQALAERLEGPIGEQGLKEQSEVVGSIGGEKEAFFQSRAGKTPRSIDKTARRVLEEVGEQFDVAGLPKPLTASERKTLGKLAEEVLEVRLVPKTEAGREVRKYKGGGKQFSDDDMMELVNRVPELETTIRQAERVALDAAKKATTHKPLSAKASLHPGPEDIANTVRDVTPTPPKSAALRDTRGGDEFFHGTSKEFGAFDEGHYGTMNIYGQGFYTTDAVDVAKGYTKKGRGENKAVYRVKPKGELKMYDLETQMDADTLAFVKSLDNEAAKIALSENPKSLREFYDKVREISRHEGYSADDIQEMVFEPMAERLLERGYAGISHQGGRFTGTKAHRVRIYFHPERDLSFEKIELGSYGQPGAATERGSTMIPPPTERATLRSPSFKSPRARKADVSVQEPLNEGRIIRGEAEGGAPAFGFEDVPELAGHVYVVGPRKMSARDLDGLIGRLSDKVKDLKNRKGSAPLEDRLLAAAMEDANKYPMPGQSPMAQGDKERKGFGAFRARSDVALTGLEKKLQGAGLPRRLEPMPGEPGEAPRPRLDANAEKTQRGTIENFSGSNKDLAALADARGVGKELRQIAGLDAYQALDDASGMRAFFGSQGNLSFYSGNPGEYFALRWYDPIARGLSKAKPKAPPISEDLYQFVKQVAASSGDLWRLRMHGIGGPRRPAGQVPRKSLDPIRDINRATSLGSARNLAPAAATGAGRKERYTLADFTPDEMALFDRIVESMKEDKKRRAASGE